MRKIIIKMKLICTSIFKQTQIIEKEEIFIVSLERAPWVNFDEPNLDKNEYLENLEILVLYYVLGEMV